MEKELKSFTKLSSWHELLPIVESMYSNPSHFVKGKYLVGTSRIQIEKIEGPVSIFAVYIYTPAKKGWDYTRFDTSAKGKLQKRSFQRVMDKLQKFVSEKEPQGNSSQE